MKATTEAAMNAWLESLRERPDPAGNTSAEWATLWGVCSEVAMKRIRVLASQGRAKFAGKRRVTRLDGRPDFAPVYSLAPRTPAPPAPSASPPTRPLASSRAAGRQHRR